MVADGMQLGPLVCRPGSVEVESGNSVVRLTAAGIEVQGPEPLDARWSDVVSLAVVGPAVARRWDKALRIWDLLSPVPLIRSGRTQVRVQTYAGAETLELEPGPGAPYDHRDLEALEAVIDVLDGAGALARLGDPSWLLPVLRRSAAARSRLAPLTYRRVRRIVLTSLP